MSHCPSCLQYFVRKANMEKHCAGCSADAPTLQELTKLVYTLAHEVETLRAQKDKPDASFEPAPTATEFPTLDESDLHGFYKENVDFLITKYDWPVKIIGKNSLKIFQRGMWVPATPALLDEITSYLYKQLSGLLFEYCQTKSMDDDSHQTIAEMGQKISCLTSNVLKKAFLAN